MDDNKEVVAQDAAEVSNQEQATETRVVETTETVETVEEELPTPTEEVAESENEVTEETVAE